MSDHRSVITPGMPDLSPETRLLYMSTHIHIHTHSHTYTHTHTHTHTLIHARTHERTYAASSATNDWLYSFSFNSVIISGVPCLNSGTKKIANL